MFEINTIVLPKVGESLKISLPKHWRPLQAITWGLTNVLWYSANPGNETVDVVITGVASRTKVDTLGQYIGSCLAPGQPMGDTVHYFVV